MMDLFIPEIGALSPTVPPVLPEGKNTLAAVALTESRDSIFVVMLILVEADTE